MKLSRISPRARMRVHVGLLLPWLIFISCYAIVCTHWAGFEGAAPSAKEGEG